MNIYNVYFSANENITREEIELMTTEYIKELKNRKLISSASLQKLVDKANFSEIPDYHLAVFFKDQNDMEQSFKQVRAQLLNTYPHNILMKSVSEFKVSFSLAL
ncbi:DUF6614 family protein [Vibrio sinaloensis]|uniref:DUF6614 family protein n=1 Tax=Photobacterium sp. (strain ATCC 43367) TaxID=379097 RepID=UPI0035ED607B